MRRVLLNKIFSKFPELGNIEVLVNLGRSDLEEILSSNTLLDAERRLEELVDVKNQKKENNSKSLSLEAMFYVNY